MRRAARKSKPARYFIDSRREPARANRPEKKHRIIFSANIYEGYSTAVMEIIKKRAFAPANAESEIMEISSNYMT